MKQKKPKEISPGYLERAGLFYLERYSSSIENFRRVMRRKIDRSCRYHEHDPAPHYESLEAVIQKFIDQGFLNDALYTKITATSLRRKGQSKKMIALKLKQKGVENNDLESLIETIDWDEFDPAVNETDLSFECMSAMRHIRKKRLGPYRRKQDEKSHEKDLASLARAGYSYAISKKALEHAHHEQEDDHE